MRVAQSPLRQGLNQPLPFAWEHVLFVGHLTVAVNVAERTQVGPQPRHELLDKRRCFWVAAGYVVDQSIQTMDGYECLVLVLHSVHGVEEAGLAHSINQGEEMTGLSGLVEEE